MNVQCYAHDPKLDICRWEGGVPVPEVSPVPGWPVYRHEPATRVSITRSPLTRDPYEARHVAGDV